MGLCVTCTDGMCTFLHCLIRPLYHWQHHLSSRQDQLFDSPIAQPVKLARPGSLGVTNIQGNKCMNQNKLKPGLPPRCISTWYYHNSPRLHQLSLGLSLNLRRGRCIFFLCLNLSHFHSCLARWEHSEGSVLLPTCCLISEAKSVLPDIFRSRGKA